ncbi:hypothetical protein Aspvir_003832 [Aspergillus viridinutans]|uniref:Uncharacterized protein n=1 Tax=Aspergillus viridinutans TaxID=75553 RepID=A0A9P3BNK8_ASPVI|nr:uncharacterized protein Aspvir_003832 [Aspergillus viridinutans]GIJ99824.1 hypothetical protein Aspvir_003832 [Aspergillus viridinutans]
MRKRAGLNYLLPTPAKPDYLVLVNSFFGLEVPKDLPPLVAAVGPILSDEYPPLDDIHQRFLDWHAKTIYVALGTHIILLHADARKIIKGLIRAMEAGLIDGVIWSVGKSGRQLFDTADQFTIAGQTRSILDHAYARIYFTHGGGFSASEGLYHGKPMLVMPFFFDQISNAAKLAAGGTSEVLHKFRFTAEEVYTKMKLILEDRDGSYGSNVLHLQRIAQGASRRKQLGGPHRGDFVRYGAEGRGWEGDAADASPDGGYADACLQGEELGPDGSFKLGAGLPGGRDILCDAIGVGASTGY